VWENETVVSIAAAFVRLGKTAVNSKQYFLAIGLALTLAGCAGSAAGVAPGTTAINGGAVPQLRNVTRSADSTLPTLYVLNGHVKTSGWVSAYSDAGATFVRKFGSIGGSGAETANMAADASGHLYLYSGNPLGQVMVYENYGAAILQTLQRQKQIYTSLTLDRFGNLFAMATNKRTFSGPLDEFVSSGNGSLKEKPLVRRDAQPFYNRIATDTLGDVAAVGGLNGFKAYTKKEKTPFWTLNASDTTYREIAFDSSNNLYVAEAVDNSTEEPIAVYARGASSPMYSIQNGVYFPLMLALDGSRNLYALDYCPTNCGSNPSEEITVYAPGATSPNRVLLPSSASFFSDFAVSSSGYVAAVEYQNSSIDGSVVVYRPGATDPTTMISTGLQDPLQVAFGN
jgi:hypothetical protein